MLKHGIFALTLLLAANAFADGLNYDPKGPSQAEVTVAKVQLSNFVLAMKGINGIGITACEKDSGVPFYKLDQATLPTSTFVNCIEIMGETKESTEALQTLFPEGSKYKGIYFYVSFGGVIRPL